MTRKILLLLLIIPLQTFAGIVQQIVITNSLWNPNATGGVAGMTPSAVTVAFNNGGARPCYTTTLAYSHSITVLVGTGQICSTSVTSLSVSPVANTAGAVFAIPAPATIDNVHYLFQVTIQDGGDPVFDSTNGLIETPGTTQVEVTAS